jgi:phage head maturation protease
MSNNVEKRTFNAQIEVREEADGKLEGHAAVFNEPTEIAGMFMEVIKPGAFRSAIKRDDDVRALFNHVHKTRRY